MDNLQLKAEDEDVMNLDPDRSSESLNGSDLEDEHDERMEELAS